jgi:peptidoglycan/LPS O-acetylase OafA/YrhL
MNATLVAAEHDRTMVVRERSHRYAALDAMRGLAAFAVVVYHLDRPYAPSAYIAVDFFYVLSGFVIARAYGEKILDGMTVTAFMKARYRRLYPLFLLGSIYGLGQFLFFWKSNNFGVADFVANIGTTLAMLPSPTFLTRPIDQLLPLYPLNGPAWSLFWELLVNLLFAVLLVRLRIRHLVAVVACSLGLLVASVFFHRSLDLGWEWKSVDGGLFRVLFSFTMGIVIYRMHASTRPHLSYLAFLPVAFLCTMLLAPTQSLKFALGFCILLSPLIVIAGARLEVPRKFQPICIFLGYLSYPIYVCHRGFTEIYDHFAGSFRLPPALYIFLYLAFIAVVSFLSAQAISCLTEMRRPARAAVDNR